MKLDKAKIYIFFILITLFLFSCQSEENVVLQDDTENLISGSQLVDKMLQLTQNPVWADNIIDSTDCFSVKLPVNVLVNGQELHIAEISDFISVEDIFNESQQDVDMVQVELPATVVYADYTQSQILTQEDWDLASECVNTASTGLKCLRFVYPLSVNIYDTIYQVADVQVMDDDMEFYGFLNNLNENVLSAIAYPVVVVKPDGEEVDCNNNNELLSVLSMFYECD
ncbi:hypothetical protein FUA48_07960 [Flavobacterium alkalisoli]|uniref:Uncharacterized protein n=1 Tax=Flavobacterium alkalisoli TaxID=2602769 RepID=A0A5B9FXS1_9FLAO|nr:hypothetical protein [Flavobacterium alkalisoli]QEE49517.1 hypothetical protein FUA48_07960 [Flavobacterium alkalisoli]